MEAIDPRLCATKEYKILHLKKLKDFKELQFN
jgi:hypothetical protein